jgi:hypothetical protein
MKFFRLLAFMVLGATVMIVCLLWVAQFFGIEDDTTPVIWLEKGVQYDESSESGPPRLPGDGPRRSPADDE